jgi:Domain of unknown function (DUF222)/HNH endonuclease
MAQGKLSYCKVRVLTRVADSSTEDYFLNIALHGTVHHVEKLVQAFRRSREAEEISREISQQQNRSLTWYHDEDGSLVMKVRLPAETGAIVLKALEAALPGPELGSVTAATLRELPQPAVRRADALGMIAESFLAHGHEALSGGDRQQIVVHVDAETLSHKTSGRCEHEQGPAMAAETARRLACDASLVRIIENGEGEPLDVGRKTRTIPSAIRRALASRDKGCRFPGCTLHRYIDGHHVKHWADGGETKLSNLVLLCRFHHRLVHEGASRSRFSMTAPYASCVLTVAISTLRSRTRPLANGRRSSSHTAMRASRSRTRPPRPAGVVSGWITALPSKDCCNAGTEARQTCADRSILAAADRLPDCGEPDWRLCGRCRPACPAIAPCGQRH